MGSDSSKHRKRAPPPSDNGDMTLPSIRLPSSQSCYDMPSTKGSPDSSVKRSRAGSSCSVGQRHSLNARQRRLIQSCFSNPHETIGRRIMKRAAEARDDFGRFYSNMDNELRENIEESMKTLLKKVVTNIDFVDEVQRLSEGFGMRFADLCSTGFKPDYFAVIADATITECTHLDSAVHKAHTTTHAFSQFGAMVFSSVRDGYYHEVRRKRRASNSFSVGSNSSCRRKKSGDSRTSSRCGSPRSVSPESEMADECFGMESDGFLKPPNSVSLVPTRTY